MPARSRPSAGETLRRRDRDPPHRGRRQAPAPDADARLGRAPRRARDRGDAPRRRRRRARPPRLALPRRRDGRGGPAAQRRQRERAAGATCSPSSSATSCSPAPPRSPPRSARRSPGLLAATLARLCQGQVAEVRSAYRIDRSDEDYLAAIADKTGALMATACRIGALTAELDDQRPTALTAFGESFGMVFQIRDDVLDVVATEEELGKPPGQDLAEGIYTLPVQRALVDRRVGAGAARPARPAARPRRRRARPGARRRLGRDRRVPGRRPPLRPRGGGDRPAPRRRRRGAVARGLGVRLVDDLDRSMRALAS